MLSIYDVAMLAIKIYRYVCLPWCRCATSCMWCRYAGYNDVAMVAMMSLCFLCCRYAWYDVAVLAICVAYYMMMMMMMMSLCLRWYRSACFLMSLCLLSCRYAWYDVAYACYVVAMTRMMMMMSLCLLYMSRYPCYHDVAIIKWWLRCLWWWCCCRYACYDVAMHAMVSLWW